MREKTLTPYGEFSAFKVETDDGEDVGRGIERVRNGVGGEDVLGVRIGVPEEPG